MKNEFTKINKVKNNISFNKEDFIFSINNLNIGFNLNIEFSEVQDFSEKEEPIFFDKNGNLNLNIENIDFFMNGINFSFKINNGLIIGDTWDFKVDNIKENNEELIAFFNDNYKNKELSIFLVNLINNKLKEGINKDFDHIINFIKKSFKNY